MKLAAFESRLFESKQYFKHGVVKKIYIWPFKVR